MNQAIFFNSFKLFISKLIPVAILSVISIIYSWKLSPEEYGAYQAVWTYLSICVVFTSFGLPSYILTYGTQLTNDLLVKAIRIIAILFFCMLIPICFFLFFLNQYFDYVTKLYFVLLLLFQTVFLIQESFLIVKQESSKLIFVNSVYSILLLIAHIIVLYWLPYQLSSCLVAILLLSLLRILYLYPISNRGIITFTTAGQSASVSISLLFWLGLNGSLQIITKWMDKLILLFFLPAAEYAVYFNGTYELPLIGTLLVAFQSMISVYSSKDSDKEDKLLETFSNAALFMSSILFPLFAFVFFYSETLITAMFSNKYQESSILFAISVLILPARICSYSALLQIKNKGKIILTGSIIDFFSCLVLMGLLYPFFKLNGLVLATVLATYIQILYYLSAIAKVYVVSLRELLPIKELAIRLLLVCIFLASVKYVFFFLPPVVNMLVGLLAAMITGLIYFNKSISIKKLREQLLS